MKRVSFAFVAAAVLACAAGPVRSADDPLADDPATLPLDGTWRFQLDADDVGQAEQWFNKQLSDSIHLPGTTDLAGKGHPYDPETNTYAAPFEHSSFPSKPPSPRINERGFLVRQHMYIGPAWYQRAITVPHDWANKHVRLHLERVIWTSRAWVDGRAVGELDSLVAPHVHDLGQLAPGEHRLTLCIDNRMVHNLSTIGHAYGPETQSRWNGVVGRIYLTAVDPVHLDKVQVFPAADRKAVRVRMQTVNMTDRRIDGTLRLIVEPGQGGAAVGASESTLSIPPGEHAYEQIVKITQPVQAWDEFETARYRLRTKLGSDAGNHTCQTLFGFRHIERDGRHIRINGRRLFLRGTLDCCNYPKTGHPPVTVDEWHRVLAKIKEYGFNHVRFHSWCPPEAAFEAADRLGVYLAPETPFWVDGWTLNTYSHPQALGHDPEVTDYVRREIRRISDAYGNHPSFTFFCIGNEFAAAATDWNSVNQLVSEAKQYDPRRLYNASTARKRVDGDDYWVTHNSGKPTRGIGPAHTNWDFHAAAMATDLPVVAHETGQRPVFPDYNDLLPKFDRPLKPYNLIRFQRELAERGMADQVMEFERASAKFQIVQYKAEHEGMLRTPDYAGYQLLMLNDFTGQSEALVGVLDPFWESKGVVTPDDVRRWNAATVPLARFDRFTWTTDQEFNAAIEVAHFGPRDLAGVTPHWSLVTTGGEIIAEGPLETPIIPTGQVTHLGEINTPLTRIEVPSAMTLTVRVGDVVNQWKHWVYRPAGEESAAGDAVIIAKAFDADVERALAEGRRVLIFGHGRARSGLAAKTGFESVYWSAGWWGNAFSSLGVLCDPAHPALALFPNDGHSDWQWYTLTSGATTFILDEAPRGFRPIVQPITDFHHNHLLGHLYEARVGQGQLVVCGYDLTSNLEARHAARQLRRSLLSYMQSDAFLPDQELSAGFLRRLLGDASGRPSQ